MNRLVGKVAIITGGSKGMGASHARTFIDEGAYVAITDIDSEDGIALANDLGQNAIFIQADVTSPDDWGQVVNEVNRTFGTVNILVNNAGISGPSAELAELNYTDYLQVVNVDQHGTFLGMQAVIPDMLRAGSGSIVNIASASSYRHMDPNPNVAYTAAKHAVLGLTKGAAYQYGKHGIRINAVCPGGVLTPMVKEAVSQEQLDQAVQTIPLGRLADPKDVSRLVLFLASDEASYLSGAGYLVDGAQLAH